MRRSCEARLDQVTIALISLSREDPETGLPLGLSQLFGTTVVDQQLRAARAFGAESFVLLCSKLPKELLQHSDRWRLQGVSVDIVRTGAELAQLAAESDRAIFLGDGILPGDALAEKLNEAGSAIYVVENDEQLKEYERIDLTHRWLGVGQFDFSHLSALTDIPDDWDIGSALLRTAVQAGTRREQVSVAQLDEGFLSNLNSTHHVASYQRQVLSGGTGTKGNMFQRFLIKPLKRWALPKLWKRPEFGSYLGWGSLALGLVALPAAWFGLTAVALSAVLLGLIGSNIAGSVHLYDALATDRKILHRMALFIPPAVLLLCTIRSSPDFQGNPLAVYGNIVMLAALLGSLYLAEKSSDFGKLDIIRPDSLLLLVFLTGITVFGAFLPGLYTATLLAMLMLVVNQSKTPKNGGKQP